MKSGPGWTRTSNFRLVTLRLHSATGPKCRLSGCHAHPSRADAASTFRWSFYPRTGCQYVNRVVTRPSDNGHQSFGCQRFGQDSNLLLEGPRCEAPLHSTLGQCRSRQSVSHTPPNQSPQIHRLQHQGLFLFKPCGCVCDRLSAVAPGHLRDWTSCRRQGFTIRRLQPLLPR